MIQFGILSVLAFEALAVAAATATSAAVVAAVMAVGNPVALDHPARLCAAPRGARGAAN